MFQSVTWPLLLALLGVSACSPALNWREVPIQGTSMTALMPCKPDRSQRKISLAGNDVDMVMQSCDADGVTFALAHVSLPAAALVPAALAHWQQATWAHIVAHIGVHSGAHSGALAPAARPLKLPGNQIPPLVWTAQGKRSNGEAVEFNGLWAAQDAHLVQVAMYTPVPRAAVRDIFFDGFKLQ